MRYQMIVTYTSNFDLDDQELNEDMEIALGQAIQSIDPGNAIERVEFIPKRVPGRPSKAIEAVKGYFESSLNKHNPTPFITMIALDLFTKTDMKPSTLKRVLKQLVNEGYVEPHTKDGHKGYIRVVQETDQIGFDLEDL